jgi:Tol biopolymer transport system component
MGTPAFLRSHRRLVAALLPAAALLAVAHPAPARAESRIVVRQGGKRLVAISPTTGSTRTLVRLRRGAILGTAAARDGATIAFASRTFGEVDGERVWTDRLSTMRPGGRPRVVRTVVTSGRERGLRPVNSLALSPDGRELLFETNAHAAFVMGSDGAGLRRVPTSRSLGLGYGRNSSGPEFTPDGKRIIATFYPQNAPVTALGGIGTVPVAGGHVHLITRGPNADGVGNYLAPTVSPDGRTIAYTLSRRSDTSIWAMDRDGSDRRRVVYLPGWNLGNPSFSPSGRSLTFVGKRPEPGRGGTVIGKSPSALFTVRLDGSHLQILRREPARLFDRGPVWVRWSNRWPSS